MTIKTTSLNKNLYKTENISAVKVAKPPKKKGAVQLTPTAPKEMRKVLNSMTKLVMEQYTGQKIKERKRSFHVKSPGEDSFTEVKMRKPPKKFIT